MDADLQKRIDAIKREIAAQQAQDRKPGPDTPAGYVLKRNAVTATTQPTKEILPDIEPEHEPDPHPLQPVVKLGACRPVPSEPQQWDPHNFGK